MGDHDLRIVDYALWTARELHPDSRVVFLTSDRGTPTILLKSEARRLHVRNLMLQNTEELLATLESHFPERAILKNLIVYPDPVYLNGKPGLECYACVDVQNMADHPLWLGVYLAEVIRGRQYLVRGTNPSFQDGNGRLSSFQRIIPPTPSYSDARPLWIPYSAMGTLRSRYGMKRVVAQASIWDGATARQISIGPPSPLVYACGRHYLRIS